MAEQAPVDFLEMANGQVLAAHALCDDLLAMLFPYSEVPPSELLQTRVKLKLLALVDGIERQLLPETQGTQRSWDVLARSGLLREKILVHFALARIAEERIEHKMQVAGVSPLAQLPAKLLRDENANLAEMARKLLQAERSRADDQLYLRLNAETLHMLCWRIVAVLQQTDMHDQDTLATNAKALLAGYTADADLAAAARKLAFFLGADCRDALTDPEIAGLHLFIAALSQFGGADSDLLYRLIGEASAESLALVLRASDVDAEKINPVAAILQGSVPALSAGQIAQYAALDPVDARAAVSAWQSEWSAE